MITNSNIVSLVKCKHLDTYTNTEQDAQQSFLRQLMDQAERLQERKKETEKVGEQIRDAYNILNDLVSSSMLILDQENRQQIKEALNIISKIKISASRKLAQINMCNAEWFQQRVLELLEIGENSNE